MPCQCCLAEDRVYKDVVIIGNGPSGIITSFMMSGQVPYLKQSIPEDIPLDEMLAARLNNERKDRPLLEADLMDLAEGLEGRSNNPVSLLMDNLLNPCADLSLDVPSLVDWRFEPEKQIDHIVLGTGPPGGSWHCFEASPRTVSPARWLALPPHAALPGYAPLERARACDVAAYYEKYVREMGLQRYFRSSAIVTSVRRLSSDQVSPCSEGCTQKAVWCVSGYDSREERPFRYTCGRVVLASGANDIPNRLAGISLPGAIYNLSKLDAALSRISGALRSESFPPALVIGSGLSAADALVSTQEAGLPALHVYKPTATALRGLSAALYPEYHHIYKMMQEGPSVHHSNYFALPEHALLEVTLLDREDTSPDMNAGLSNDILTLKRVKLVNLVTNEIVEMTVSLLTILVGSKPDLHFLPGNLDLNFIDNTDDKENITESINVTDKNDICIKCHYNNQLFNGDTKKHGGKRKMGDVSDLTVAVNNSNNNNNPRPFFLRAHWHNLKTVLGQGIQICKSKYLENNLTGVLGNNCKDDSKALSIKVHNRFIEENRVVDSDEICNCYCSRKKKVDHGRTSVTVPVSGLGVGVDPTKAVDCRSNPIDIDKITHEVRNAPSGMYALGPLTGDNFVRFIPGGALAIVSHIWNEKRNGFGID